MKKLLIILSILAFAGSHAFAQAVDDDTYYSGDQSTVSVQSQETPPPLPDYVQPPCPADGYMWQPGYWAWGQTGYYWIPGVWVLPPQPGFLWTPGYWGFYGGYYGWHHGYWGTEIGYYGGINYGFGYYGSGFYGGRWEGGHFRYNTAVWRVNNRVVHNTYVDRSVVRRDGARVSFNGPRGGVNVRPAPREETYMKAAHTERTGDQQAHEKVMSSERGQFHAAGARPAVHSMSMPNGQRFNQRGRPVKAQGGGAPHGGGGGGRGKH